MGKQFSASASERGEESERESSICLPLISPSPRQRTQSAEYNLCVKYRFRQKALLALSFAGPGTYDSIFRLSSASDISLGQTFRTLIALLMDPSQNKQTITLRVINLSIFLRCALARPLQLPSAVWRRRKLLNLINDARMHFARCCAANLIPFHVIW